MSIHPSRTISVSIDRDWREVYDFASVPQNFPRWAAGLGTRFERSGEEWTAQDPDGRPIRIRFSRPNEFGVLDHIVFAEGGAETRNAMRVVANGTGAEVDVHAVADARHDGGRLRRGRCRCGARSQSPQGTARTLTFKI